ncbi:AGE family epimerase/isomerase [Aeromicrobium ginsengisoli]|uniref:AGE family epimerase/isomerase n=1 Tax=Aeromicrobium ginsengisoli TaxID=363867 RepID=A0A5M4FB75_9ACTN|nr:AGE family epimerase/isomerase [Aeromicrobium ginsengisoli]KAA1395509.1 AGE family epimerase/isomerase [Aeromicrobium ginsengisoli]
MTQSDPGSPAWRHEARAKLLAFSRQSWRQEGGFFWLDDSGTPDRDKVLELWINARMTYVFSLAHLAGDDDAQRLAGHGVRALSTVFHDEVNGGWYDRVEFDGDVPERTKGCYGHAFVLLAAASAKAAGADGADDLLTEAARIHGQKFWDPDEGRCVEEVSEDWSTVDGYRGANSNMHSVEAYLVAADVTGDDVWRRRALSICERIIGIHARAHEWRIPEHYDHDWTPLPSYNEDQPADPFRPFGSTPGHAFEWARLLLQLAAGLESPRPWIEEAAEALFAQAVDDAVSDEEPGLPYTTNWHGEPIVEERFHWVIAEAVLAAEALHTWTGKQIYAGLAERWWSEIDEHYIDHETGAWHHELSPAMHQTTRTWRGKPDAYHAFNALTLPDLPLAPSAALTLGAGA